MLNSPSGFDARKRPKNKPVLCDKSRRYAKANPERQAAPGLLSYDVATPRQPRRDALQPERVHQSLYAARLVKKSRRAKS
jgi:hypothetical protein